MKLTPTQRDALARASKGPLEFYPTGWRACGDRTVPHWRTRPKTVSALQRHGLLIIDEHRQVATITEAGRKALVESLNAEIHLFPTRPKRRVP